MNQQAQEDQIRKWMALRGQIKALKKQVKELETEGKQLEGTIIPLLKELEMEEFRIDAVMVKIKTKMGRTTVKYKELFEKAYHLVDSQAKRFIDGLRKKLTLEGKPKEYLDIEEAPPEKFGRFYGAELHTRIARLNSALSGVLMREFEKDEDCIIRAFAILASDDISKLRQAAILDSSGLVQKAAIIKLSKLAPELVRPLKETGLAKFAQEGELRYELNKLSVLVDILEEISEEM